MRFFGIFSKTAATISLKFCQNVELINSEHLAKTACPKKLPFRRYSPPKLPPVARPLTEPGKIFGRKFFFCIFGIYGPQFVKKTHKKFFDKIFPI